MSLLTSAATLVDNDLPNKRQLLKALGEEINDRRLPLAEMQRLLEGHETLRDTFFNVTAFDLSGTLVASLRDRSAKRINIAERPYSRTRCGYRKA